MPSSKSLKALLTASPVLAIGSITRSAIRFLRTSAIRRPWKRAKSFAAAACCPDLTSAINFHSDPSLESSIGAPAERRAGFGTRFQTYPTRPITGFCRNSSENHVRVDRLRAGVEIEVD